MPPESHPVRVRRLELGLPLHIVASRCGRSKALLSTVEHGYVPKPATRDVIAAALQTEPAVLWPDEYVTDPGE